MNDQRKRRNRSNKAILKRLAQVRKALEVRKQYEQLGWEVSISYHRNDVVTPKFKDKGALVISKRNTFSSGEPEHYLVGLAVWDMRAPYKSFTRAIKNACEGWRQLMAD